MAVLTTIARHVVGLSKAGHATEKRVGWIENELRNMRLGFDFLDDKIRELKGQDEQNELPDAANSNALRRKKITNLNLSLGGAQFDILDANCVGGEGTYFDILGLSAGDAIGFVVVPGQPIPDENGNSPPLEGWMLYDDDGNPLDPSAALTKFLGDGGNIGNWAPTFGGVDITITHLAVDGMSEVGGEPCMADCPAMENETIVDAPECSAITFAGGPLTVDCAGHVHEMYQHTFEFNDASYTEVSCINSTSMSFIQDVALVCSETGTSEKTFDLHLEISRYTQQVYTGSIAVMTSAYLTYDSWGMIIEPEYCCLEFECGLLARVGNIFESYCPACTAPS